MTQTPDLELAEQLFRELTDSNDSKAYAKTKEIATASELSDAYFPYLNLFASLVSSESSYIRTRAMVLCCSQARWDAQGAIKQILPELLTLLHDPKPTVVRQCLNAVHELIAFRPELSPDIQKAIESIDLSMYRESMSHLIQKDTEKVMELLKDIL